LIQYKVEDVDEGIYLINEGKLKSGRPDGFTRLVFGESHFVGYLNNVWTQEGTALLIEKKQMNYIGFLAKGEDYTSP